MKFKFILIALFFVNFSVAQTFFDNGGGDNLWSTAANWNPDGVPTSSDDILFMGATVVIDISNATANDIAFAFGNSNISISKNGALTVEGELTINSGSSVALNSDSNEFSSLIVKGASSGNITYNRYVNTVGANEWDLVGSPVGGLSISSFVTANSSSLANNGSGTSALGEYNNANDTWSNHSSSAPWLVFYLRQQ